MAATKKSFLTNAPDIQVVIAGQSFTASPRTFSSGKVGYYVNGKITVRVPGGEPVTLQVGANLTAVKSDEWEDE